MKILLVAARVPALGLETSAVVRRVGGIMEKRDGSWRTRGQNCCHTRSTCLHCGRDPVKGATLGRRLPCVPGPGDCWSPETAIQLVRTEASSTKTEALSLKRIWDWKGPQIIKMILKKKNKVGGLALPNFKTYSDVRNMAVA